MLTHNNDNNAQPNIPDDMNNKKFNIPVEPDTLETK